MVFSKPVPPLVSIGLPVYNEEAFVADAVRSVFAQSFRDWELTIVDDGSTDKGPSWLERLQDPRVSFARDGQHRGLGTRLNQIVALAQGKYIARMDADDLMHPERIASQVEFLERNPEVDVVGCSVLSFNARGEPLSLRQLPQEHERITASPLNGFALAHATTVASAEWWRAHLYDEVTRACEDVELWLGSYRSSRFANLPAALYFYREEQSYSFREYVAAKSELASRLWKRRAEYGASAVCSSLLQWPRIAAYGLAHVLGADRALVRRRGSPVSSDQAEEFLRCVQRIRTIELPLGPD